MVYGPKTPSKTGSAAGGEVRRGWRSWKAGGCAVHQCGQIGARRDEAGGMEGEEGPEVILPPVGGAAGGGHPRQGEKRGCASARGRAAARGAAGCSRTAARRPSPSESGWGTAPHRPGWAPPPHSQRGPGRSCSQGLIRRLQGVEQVRLGLVVGGLAAGEAAAIHAVVHAALQTLPPASIASGPPRGSRSGAPAGAGQRLSSSITRALSLSRMRPAAAPAGGTVARAVAVAAAAAVELGQGGAAGRKGWGSASGRRPDRAPPPAARCSPPAAAGSTPARRGGPRGSCAPRSARGRPPPRRRPAGAAGR